MQHHLPHPVTSTTASFSDALLSKKGKRRGSYNCGRCGLPKKGHICHLPPPPVTDSISSAVTPADSSTSSAIIAAVPVSVSGSPICSTRTDRKCSKLRRALSFDDMDVCEKVMDVCDEVMDDDDDEIEEEEVVDFGCGKMPVSCMWEVMRRLPPAALLTAAKVCTGWRDVTKQLWKAAEEVRLRVPAKVQVGFVGSVLQKCCSALVRLSLTVESDMDSTMLACIAFACPNLESLEINMCEGSVNRIMGYPYLLIHCVMFSIQITKQMHDY
ncbi:putative F-box domain, leucine-rich repeat domain superfamily, F-box-like domain superfamily [Helianthus annuus]|nr:putative F-box domain, leucine-rich repeat domain superfamily, F-box-like domain superfamily [Helianthus annuus]